MSSRLAGIDAARALALVGMFAVHILPARAAVSADGGPGVAEAVAAGRSAALFAVLAGVGVALASRGASWSGATANLVTRAALVGLIGLALGSLASPVAVILAYYGLLFLAAVPLLRLPSGASFTLAAAWCIAAPVLSHLLRVDLPPGPGEQADLAMLAEPVTLARTLLLTGYYPVLTYLTYLMAGLAVGRLDLRRRRCALGLLGGGAALAGFAWAGSAVLLGPLGGTSALGGSARVAADRYGTTPTDSWWWLAVVTPHSETPFAIAHTIGTALAVLGGCLLLASAAPRLAAAPAAVGALPLTLYTGHVLALAVYPGRDGDLGAVFLAHLTVAVCVALLLRAARRRGPLEVMVSDTGRAARRMVSAGQRSGG